MGRLRAEESARVREDLITGGLAAFWERGFGATGIQEIAQGAGIPKGSFYNYFASKDAFAAEVIDRYVDAYLDAWDAHMAERPRGSLEALRTAFEALIAFNRATGFGHGCLIGNLAGEGLPTHAPCREAMARAADRVRARLAGVLADAQGEGTARTDLSADALAEFFWNAWSGGLLEAKIRRSAEPLEHTLRCLIDSFIAVRTP